MLVAIVLGLLQGSTEWLPISSEGVVATSYVFFFDRPLSEAVAYALWLHLGTATSALVVFRKEITRIIGGFIAEPRKPSRLLAYLVVSTITSAVVGIPLLVSLSEISGRLGAIAMGLVGFFMLITGGIQLRRSVNGTRTRDEVSITDALFAGLAQGCAVLPGLSRSGLTVATLLARNVDRREALVLSFLMSIPASLGAGIYASIDTGLLTSTNALYAAGVAAVVGLITIRILPAVAEKVNFAKFVILVGAAVIAGAVWQALQ